MSSQSIKRKQDQFFTIEQERFISNNKKPKRTTKNSNKDDDYDTGRLKCYLTVHNKNIQPILNRVDSQEKFDIINIDDIFIDKIKKKKKGCDDDEWLHATITIDKKNKEDLKSYLIENEEFNEKDIFPSIQISYSRCKK